MGSRAAVSLLPVRRWIERRDVVLAAAAALFIVVFALCHTGPEPGEGIALLYVVPIALVALELGLVAGICASALALGLVGVWALDSHTELDAVGFLTRGGHMSRLGCSRAGSAIACETRTRDRSCCWTPV